VQGSGFRVQGSGFSVKGSGFRVQGSGSWVQGSGFVNEPMQVPVTRISAKTAAVGEKTAACRVPLRRPERV
jgi:hypothetical protein